jgi:hypothetical protein
VIGPIVTGKTRLSAFVDIAFIDKIVFIRLF